MEPVPNFTVEVLIDGVPLVEVVDLPSVSEESELNGKYATALVGVT